MSRGQGGAGMWDEDTRGGSTRWRAGGAVCRGPSARLSGVGDPSGADLLSPRKAHGSFETVL